MMEMSESIADLAGALAKAQAKITGALKDSANPFFKSKYADLASVWDACREHLSSNGLSVIQTTDLDDSGVTIVTTLAHASGQWVRGRLRMMPTKSDPQGIGSCITYARRYALAAMVGVAQVDDDANAASGKGHTKADPMDKDALVVNANHGAYADSFRDALENGGHDEVQAVHADCKNEGEEFYRAVWSLLNSKERSAIKKALDTKVAA